MVKYGKFRLFLQFEWDLLKEISNIEKHGVSFGEASQTFYDPMSFIVEDVKHSSLEARFYWVGKSELNRVLTTRFTVRGSIARIFGSAEWREFREQYYEKARHK